MSNKKQPTEQVHAGQEPRRGEDPHGYAIRYANGGGFEVVRLLDDELVATTTTRDKAIAAALADQATRSS